MTLLALALAALEERKTCIAQILEDGLVGEESVDVFPDLRVLKAKHVVPVVVGLALLYVAAQPAPPVFKAHCFPCILLIIVS